MISISHTQARRLINAQLDERKLPDEQWSALHAHLESCAECCAYRDRQRQAERRLKRGLRQRWEPVEGPLQATAPALAALYHERWELRRLGRRMLGGAAAFLLGVLLIVGLSAAFQNGAQAETGMIVTEIPPTPLPSPTPTRAPADYRGVIAYEYREPAEEGAADRTAPGEIFLLNAGSEPSNLTNHRANDHSPAWSPDGEWLAFLSDRAGAKAGEKDEVYVMHLSGSRLTRLTDLPEVTWRGPISWSADGQMLALIGERKLGETSSTWVYLVPLDGSNAYPLGQSKGAVRAVFSPVAPVLAFSGAERWKGGIALYHFAPDDERFFAVDESGVLRPNSGGRVRASVDSFEWSPDGTRLLYLARTAPDGSNSSAGLRAVDIDRAGSLFTSKDLNPYARDMRADAPFSWTGIKNEFAYLDGPAAEGCQTIHMGLTNKRAVTQPESHGFCILGALARENWRVTDKGVIVTARELGRPGKRGLYIVRFEGSFARAYWLADARGLVGTPRLRPEGERLAIEPRPVAAAGAPAEAADPSDESNPELAEPAQTAELPAPGAYDLLVTSRMNGRTLIERLDPISGERTLLNQSFGENECPTWSPDRSQIAFFSNRERPESPYNLVYVMDSSRLNTRQVSTQFVNNTYSCPIWSPDGRWLAMNGLYDVLLIPVDQEDTSFRFLYPREQGTTYLQTLGWLPDGRLLTNETNGETFSIFAYEPGKISVNRESGVELVSFKDYLFFSNVSATPDGKSLFLYGISIYEESLSSQWLYTASLEAATPGNLTIQSSYKLAGGDGFVQSIGWLPDGRPAYLVKTPDGRRNKAALFALDKDGGGEPELVAALTDTLYSAVWSADKRWLMLFTEAGLYVLDLQAEAPAPVWVNSETGTEFEWRWERQ